MLEDEQILNGVPKELAVKFFFDFSRLEYAMKMCGVLRSYTVGRAAEASWQQLANALGASFFDLVRHSDQARRLIERPPKQLFVREGNTVGFGEQPPLATNTRQLLEYAWRVRNNLFHGSKMLGVSSDRNTELMEDVIQLIPLVLGAQPNLRQAYEDVPPE